MGDTSIEWTDKTWNPVRGCSRISPGCGGAAGEGGCYAERHAYRFSGAGMAYEGLVRMGRQGPRWTGWVRLVEEHLADPLRWRKPARIFVNSMSDLFHEALGNEDIAAVFGIMAAARHHTFQVLTKRPDRMRDWFTWAQKHDHYGAYDGPLGALAYAISCSSAPLPERVFGGEGDDGEAIGRAIGNEWPLPNVWLGISAESQKYADERIPPLLATPAAVHFVSAEPLLGSLDMTAHLRPTLVAHDGERLQHPDPRVSSTGGTWEHGVDWVIAGGESGPGARPCALEWIQQIVTQCRAAKVPVFVKQLGAYVVSEERRADDGTWAWRAGLTDRKGADRKQWPEYLNVREFPAVTRG